MGFHRCCIFWSSCSYHMQVSITKVGGTYAHPVRSPTNAPHCCGPRPPTRCAASTSTRTLAQVEGTLRVGPAGASQARWNQHAERSSTPTSTATSATDGTSLQRPSRAAPLTCNKPWSSTVHLMRTCSWSWRTFRSSP